MDLNTKTRSLFKMHCSYKVTQVHKNALIITCLWFYRNYKLVIKTIFSFQQCTYANILNMARIEKKKENKERKITFFDRVSQKGIYNKKLFSFFFLLPKTLNWTNKSVNLTTGQAATMKTTNPVLVLFSEKGKLAGKSGQWTLASSGSLVHLCNEPLHKGFICCFSA